MTLRVPPADLIADSQAAHLGRVNKVATTLRLCALVPSFRWRRWPWPRSGASGCSFARRYELGSLGYPWLTWNLTLAWVPLARRARSARGRAARAADARARRSRLRLAALPAERALRAHRFRAPRLRASRLRLGRHRVVRGDLARARLRVGCHRPGQSSRVRAALLPGWAVAAASLLASSVGVYLGPRPAPEQLGRGDAAGSPLVDRADRRSRIPSRIGTCCSSSAGWRSS